jgi:hypothetical protein
MSCNEGGWNAKIDSELVFKTTLAEEMGIYFVLRPEQRALADEPVELRDMTTGALTDTEKTILSALTPEKYAATGMENQEIAIWAYKEAGIDVSANFDLTVWNMMKSIFTGSMSNRTPHLPNSTATEYDAENGRMLVDGYYGGAHVKWDGGFTNAQFQVGDVLFAVYYPDTTVDKDKKYYAGICIGDDKFLISDNVATDYCDGVAIKTFDEIVNANMGIYFVLRPEQLTQEVSIGLIAETRAKLSALTANDLTGKSDTGVIKEFCKQAGMTQADVEKFSSIVTISTDLFNKPSGANKWSPKTFENPSTYQKLFVQGYYGGVKFGTENSKIFASDGSDFEIGDIFCAQYAKNSKIRYIGLYQGNGKFLMTIYNDSDKSIDYTGTAELVFDNIVNNFNYYFVLRPAQYLNTPASPA